MNKEQVVIDPSKLSSEVADKYTLVNNALKTVVKDNPKDLVEVEIGDTKQPDFKPQVKIMRWDNEVNFSARLVTDIEQIPIKDGSVINTNNIKFYEIPLCKEHPEGGYEFEIELKEKPLTNVVTFTIRTKGLEFLYQPELTEEEIKQGHFRPDNVIGSYAVYYKNTPKNYEGGKEYKTGKALHIYRPKIVDAEGSEVWGVLNIDEENQLMTVTIPQEFLDNAVYPVRHAGGATFGYSSVGATTTSITSSGFKAVCTESGTGTKISQYLSTDTSSSRTRKFALYSNTSPGNLISNGDAGSRTFNSASPGWYDWNFTTSPDLSAQTYRVTYDSSSGINMIDYYDTGSAGDRYNFDSVYATFPTSTLTWSYTGGTQRYSIYVTYTAGGATVVKDMLGGIIPFAR